MNKAIFDRLPALQTDRLDFRLIHKGDSGLLFEFNSDLESLKFVPRTPFIDISQAEEKLAECENGFKNRTALWWVLSLRDSGETIGYGGLFDINPNSDKAEIGYGLLPGFWRRGYASEAVAEIVGFGFDTLELHRIYGYIVPGNAASVKILENLGFTLEGVLKDDDFGRGRFFDMSVYARINHRNG
jgi:[ribosomal protein S5]-alanine N-acetyltransferase